MDFIGGQISYFTECVRSLITLLNIQPESYIWLFPAGKDAETIKQLVSDGVFPTISGLAPAITYALVLSAIRFTIEIIFMKVVKFNSLGNLIYDVILMQFNVF
jgi:hypothetical protein